MDAISRRHSRPICLHPRTRQRLGGSSATTIQAIGFSDREDEFRKLDTIVFGVSRDDVLSHQAFRDEHGITVNLLADTDAEVCKLYDVIQEKVVDGHTRPTLLRSTFVIDKKGVVRHILQDVNPKGHVDAVLKVCRELNGKKAHAN